MKCTTVQYYKQCFWLSFCPLKNRTSRAFKTQSRESAALSNHIMTVEYQCDQHYWTSFYITGAHFIQL